MSIESRFNLKGLEDMRRQMGNQYIARVGVLGENVERKDEESGLTNGELAIIQIFGSITKNIPPRDFLLMPILKKKREIMREMMSSAQVKRAFNMADYKKVFALLGVLGEKACQEAFETAGFGQWPPNAPATIAAKGSSQPLINSGQLRDAVTSDVASKSEAQNAIGASGVS